MLSCKWKMQVPARTQPPWHLQLIDADKDVVTLAPSRSRSDSLSDSLRDFGTESESLVPLELTVTLWLSEKEHIGLKMTLNWRQTVLIEIWEETHKSEIKSNRLLLWAKVMCLGSRLNPSAGHGSTAILYSSVGLPEKPATIPEKNSITICPG